VGERDWPAIICVNICAAACPYARFPNFESSENSIPNHYHMSYAYLVSWNFVPSTEDADIREGACVLEHTCRLARDGIILENLLLEDGGELCVQAVYLRGG
jgi:hypothetical protein